MPPQSERAVWDHIQHNVGTDHSAVQETSLNGTVETVDHDHGTVTWSNKKRAIMRLMPLTGTYMIYCTVQ